MSTLIDLDLLLRNLVRVLSRGDLTNLGWSTWFLLLRNLVLLLSLYLDRSSLSWIGGLLLRNLVLILCLCLDWSNLRCRRILLLRNKIIFRGLCLNLFYLWWCANCILYRNCRGSVGVLLILTHVFSVVDFFKIMFLFICIFCSNYFYWFSLVLMFLSHASFPINASCFSFQD